jgi:hypothetical protein
MDLAQKKQVSTNNKFNLYIIHVNPSKATPIQMPAEASKIGARISKRHIYMSDKPSLGKTSKIDYEERKHRLKMSRIILNNFQSGAEMIEGHKKLMKKYVHYLKKQSKIKGNEEEEEKKSGQKA